MSSSRDEVLLRIRRSLKAHNAGTPEYEAIRRDYRQTSTLAKEAVLDLFIDRLHDYGATVRRCTPEDVSTGILEAAAAHGATEFLLAADISSRWVPEALTTVRDEELPYEAMDCIGNVLSGSALAIAETGTIVLRHAPQSGRRALSLIPDLHICVVREDRVIASVVEGIRLMASLLPAPLTTISGPSATSDIEMTRIKGVHGPRRLEVILLEGSEMDIGCSDGPA